jgi:hypothetical protein
MLTEHVYARGTFTCDNFHDRASIRVVLQVLTLSGWVNAHLVNNSADETRAVSATAEHRCSSLGGTGAQEFWRGKIVYGRAFNDSGALAHDMGPAYSGNLVTDCVFAS